MVYLDVTPKWKSACLRDGLKDIKYSVITNRHNNSTSGVSSGLATVCKSSAYESFNISISPCQEGTVYAKILWMKLNWTSYGSNFSGISLKISPSKTATG